MEPASPAIRLDAEVGDDELGRLLLAAFVDRDHPDPAGAQVRLEPRRVRPRGRLIAARNGARGELLGVAFLVAPGSGTAQVAGPDEGEIQLLAVAPDQRRRGAGRLLMEAAIAEGQRLGWAAMVLSTRPTMGPAHALYHSLGFERCAARDWIGDERPFLVFRLDLGC
ncbi:GNAT family N-acetyltransferase [Engelhardtia mirabilis]|uniref:Ribosomal-protein-alanine N-acetyltransferase n=1 Tax=Engelhardtia mirabilis TaxID=2528011 RepID=A0A518BLS2_9BACT|nr:ribosomal-protein-alanine N-acetyltransferase [Planctomycetes bacterium Pla133]QDV02249.1 ribosomal-protein-alanine N-acetyltransferase [Planctomycetes bacterium Pla86]